MPSKTTVQVKATKPKVVKKADSVKAKSAVSASKATGLSVSVYGLDGKAIGKITLPEEIFSEKANPALIAQAVRVYMVNMRRGTASTKTRSEVRGTTKKMYRQKGTGRARHGAAKAPIFVGGGIALGPRPRNFELTIPKKMRRKALFSALSSKLSENQMFVVDWEKATGKTKEIATAMNALKIAGNVMVVTDTGLETVKKASRNITGVTVKDAANISAFDVVKNGNVLFVKNSIETLKKTFLGGSK